ncbi:MAG: tetratricopeptide repeat protein [Thermoplasmata archaeon]|jgi:tetratricopeptide (TPR) repeat protein
MVNENLSKADKLYEKEMFDEALQIYLNEFSNLNDTEKIEVAKRIAECYFYKDQPDVDKALEYENYVVENLKGKDLIREKIFYSTLLAEKDIEKAKSILLEIKDDAEKNNYVDLLPEIYNSLGLMFWNTDKAEDYFIKAMNLANDLGDLENYITAIQNLAYLEAEKGNKINAMELLQKAINIIDVETEKLPKSKRKSFKESYSDLYDQAANLAMDMEDFDLAMEISERSSKY